MGDLSVNPYDYSSIVYSQEAALNEWWKQFRFLKKEEAIRVIIQVRDEIHGMQIYMNGDKEFHSNILPILHTRSLWKKASSSLKCDVYRVVMDAAGDLISNNLARLCTIDDVGFKSFADLHKQQCLK